MSAGTREVLSVEFRPAFYDSFFCLADRCRHTCCGGWEIDIDEVTLAKYRSKAGPLGEELRSALTRSPDGSWSIRFNERGFCPFLRSDGLCRLIAEEGEDFLCDICALHPRFYEDIGDHELFGVGLCCEATVSLLLDGPETLLFLDEEDRELTLAGLLSRLGLAVPEEALRFSPTVDENYYRTIFARYTPCEAIDGAWTRDLGALAACPAEDARAASVYITTISPTVGQRVFDYLLYRQLELSGEYGMDALLRYAREGTDFILLWAAVAGDLPERVRRWSAQMEYSTENVPALLGQICSPEG